MNQNNLFKEYKDVFKEPEESVSKEKKGRVFGYNPFALQDALGGKDVKKIWIEYEKLRFAGIEAEDLIHKIVSKVRDMVAIAMGANKENLGIQNDYPYNKSKRDLKNWKEKDLRILYTKLVSIYHKSRMGGDNLDISLEKTLLSI
jgi:hypothetical protein